MDKFIVKSAKKIISGFALIISLFLVVTSLIYVIDVSNMNVKQDNIFLGLAGIVAAVAVMEFVYRLSGRHAAMINRILFGVVIVYSTAAGWWWIMNSQSLPSSDQKSIYEIAVRAMNHDLLPVAPEGSYLSLWPFQSGIILIYELILRVFPGADHLTIQMCNLPFVLLLVVSGTFLVKRLFSSERAVTFWLLLTPFCLPYYLYINFMYGEIPSIGLLFFAAWMLAEAFRKGRTGRGRLLCEILAVGGAALAVVYRKNSLIFVVACVLVMGVLFLAEKRVRPLVLGGVLLCACLLAGVLPQKLYEYRAGNVMGEGVPAVSYFAMGMQDGGAAPGWWNGYHSNLFIESGYDVQKVKEDSISSIKNSLAVFASDPGYAASFYYRKLVTQWCDENYSCFYGTAALYGDRTVLAWDIYDGKLHKRFLEVMNIHQLVVYTGFFCFCILSAVRHFRKQKEPENSISQDMAGLLLLITIIGGFLFSIIWEGNSRYVLPYMVMMLPYAAGGFAILVDKAGKVLLKKKQTEDF